MISASNLGLPIDEIGRRWERSLMKRRQVRWVPSEAEIEWIVELRIVDGLTWAEIAPKFAVSAQVMSKRARDEGWMKDAGA